MNRSIPLAVSLAALTLVSSCAIANRGEISLTRTISIGQELIDLKQARDSGAISEDEYYHLKRKVIEMAESVDIVSEVNDHTPGGND